MSRHLVAWACGPAELGSSCVLLISYLPIHVGGEICFQQIVILPIKGWFGYYNCMNFYQFICTYLSNIRESNWSTVKMPGNFFL